MAPTQHLEEQTLREQAVGLITRFYEQVWNQQQLTVIDDLFAWDVLVHAGGEPLQGHADVRQLVATFMDAFPDARHEVHDVIREGDKIVVRWSATGTQQGDWLGIPPTGLEMKYDGISIFRIQDSRIAEAWLISDMMGLLQCLWR
jgi:steroid delta-isomerase-like uncharacterized protein